MLKKICEEMPEFSVWLFYKEMLTKRYMLGTVSFQYFIKPQHDKVHQVTYSSFHMVKIRHSVEVDLVIQLYLEEGKEQAARKI